MNTSEKKYCYRYVDSNDAIGRPVVILWQMLILRETEKTFWYCPDYPLMSIEQLQKLHSKPDDKSVRRCLKNAARSRYHLTREEALRAFVYRKLYQLDRVLLTTETVRLCLKGLGDSGFLEKNEDGHVGVFSNVLNVPGERFIASEEPGPIASTFGWGEY